MYQDKYYESEMAGRRALLEIIPMLYKMDDYSVQSHVSDPSEDIVYDGFASIFKKPKDGFDSSHVANHMYEIKLRERHYDNLLLEKKKFDRLSKKAKDSGADIIYICVTPVATYVFNLTKLNNKNCFKWEKEEHNISTVNSHYGTKMKSVTYLNIKDAIRVVPLTYKGVFKLLNEKRKETEKQVRDSIERSTSYRWLHTFDDIFNKEEKKPIAESNYTGFYYSK